MELTLEQKINVFESKLEQFFNSHILNNQEKFEFNIVDEKGEYIPDFEQDTSKIINIYRIDGERTEGAWLEGYDRETENYHLLWVFSYGRPGIYRITMDYMSKRLERFIRESNRFFEGKNKKYVYKEF